MRKERLIPLAVIVLVAAAIVGYQLYLRPASSDGQAQASPTPTPSPTRTASPSPTSPPPTASPTPAAARTPEEIADRLGAALEASDWTAIEKLISPSGWNAGWWASEGTPRMSPAEAVAWLRQGAQDGRLAVTVNERPIRNTEGNPSQPYVTSVWRDFDSRAGGRQPSQNAWLAFRQEADGNWYWQVGIYNPLAIPGGP